jgi:hypothetical protein
VKSVLSILLVFALWGCGMQPAKSTAVTPRPEPSASPKPSAPFNLRQAQRALEIINSQLVELEASIEVEDHVSIAVSFGSIVEEFEKLKRLTGPGDDQKVWEETQEQGIALAIGGTEATLASDMRGVRSAREALSLWIQSGIYRF